MDPPPVIGIDFGTCYSSVGCIKNGQIDIIADDEANQSIPSIVSYLENSSEVLVGSSALAQLTDNPENTFYNFKRLLGKFYGDPSFDSDTENFPFKIIANPNSHEKEEAVFAITNNHIFKTNLNKSWVSSQEVAAEILKYLKQLAEKYIGVTVKKAVITVPAFFSIDQRIAVEKAAKLAGLELLQLLNDSSAAALFYGTEHLHEVSQSMMQDLFNSKNMLIVDLGGGTTEVSLVSIVDNECQVKFVNGDSHLGGEDFTNHLLNHLLLEFSELVKTPVKNLIKNHQFIQKMQNQCRIILDMLSSRDTLFIEGFAGCQSFFKILTSGEFGQICQELFERFSLLVSNVIEISHKLKLPIHEVILLGGASEFPNIRSIVEQHVGLKNIRQTSYSEKAIVYGATKMAVQLALLETNSLVQLNQRVKPPYALSHLNNSINFPTIKLEKVTPVTIFLRLDGKIKMSIIPKNTPIPASGTINFVTAHYGQKVITGALLKEKGNIFEDSNLLGFFSIKDPEAVGETHLSITVSLNRNGIISISCQKISNLDQEKLQLAVNFSSQKPIIFENFASSLTHKEQTAENLCRRALPKAALKRRNASISVYS